MDLRLISGGIAIFAMFGQPQQSLVPGLQVLIYMLQAYLPLFVAGAVMVYVLKMILENPVALTPVFVPDRDHHLAATDRAR